MSMRAIKKRKLSRKSDTTSPRMQLTVKPVTATSIYKWVKHSVGGFLGTSLSRFIVSDRLNLQGYYVSLFWSATKLPELTLLSYTRHELKRPRKDYRLSIISEWLCGNHTYSSAICIHREKFWNSFKIIPHVFKQSEYMLSWRFSGIFFLFTFCL